MIRETFILWVKCKKYEHFAPEPPCIGSNMIGIEYKHLNWSNLDSFIPHSLLKSIESIYFMTKLGSTYSLKSITSLHSVKPASNCFTQIRDNKKIHKMLHFHNYFSIIKL